MYRAIGAALALALLTYPVEAMQSRNGNKAACVVGLLLVGPLALPLCAAGAKAQKAKVTIHKPEGGKCANGNTYRIMRVSNPRSVCKNSFRHGSAVPACANISGKNGNAHSIIIVNKAGAHLAHEIRHACDVNWNH